MPLQTAQGIITQDSGNWMFLFKYLKTSCKKQNKREKKNQHTIRELTGKETILFIVKM